MTTLSLIPKDDLVFDLKKKRLLCKNEFKLKISGPLVLPFFIGIVSLPFVPLFGLSFLVSSFILYFGITFFVNRKLRKTNHCTVPPHEEIDSFLKWKEGDRIETEHFEDKEFKGVTDNHKVILDSVYMSDDPIVLTTDYLKDHFKTNVSLNDRLERKARKEIINSARKDNRYDDFLKKAREEYSKMLE